MYSKQEAKQLRADFWTEFNTQSAIVRLKQKKQRKWMLYKTGIKGVELKFELSQSQMGVLIDIKHNDVYKRLEMYEKFEQVAALLNDSYCGKLTWNDSFVDESGVELCRLQEVKIGVNIHRTEQWPEIMAWLQLHMLSLEVAFDEVRDFLKGEIDSIWVGEGE